MGNRSLDDFLVSDDETAENETADDESVGEATDDETAEGAAVGAVDETTVDGATADEVVDGAEVDETADGEVESTDEADEEIETATAAVEPAASTYVGRSGECAVCGETTERRWHSDDGLVCPECKEW